MRNKIIKSNVHETKRTKTKLPILNSILNSTLYSYKIGMGQTVHKQRKATQRKNNNLNDVKTKFEVKLRS